MWLYSLDQFLMIKIISTLKYFQNIQFKVKRRNKEYFWVQYDCNNEAIKSYGKKQRNNRKNRYHSDDNKEKAKIIDVKNNGKMEEYT